MTIWALSTFLLVWFWVYHYLPLGPRYFKLWLFSWVFSEVIPLHFLNVPYNGRRYPVGTVYLFLSDKIYYQGKSLCARLAPSSGAQGLNGIRRRKRRPRIPTQAPSRAEQKIIGAPAL